ncbi:MAG: 23S rRNA (uracil(1939)-C(5))-methyltransferase RlmD [Verrucomicrobiae bacterium]|nr:23S rRNA (uracil(1939)-C(5))-methyltransferase RlmD [Verrucomicrobiae bacterium]
MTLQPGQRLEIEIADVAFGGDGLGRADGFVIFVPFVLTGERVEVEIVSVHKRFANADLVRVITPSPHRVEPRCRLYTQCAGCQYQHVTYRHQLELKQKQFRDIFQRIGKMPDPPIAPVVGSPREYNYRNKLVVHGPGAPGFWTMRGKSIIPVNHCPIAREEVNAKLATITDADKHTTIRSNSAGEVWSFAEPPVDLMINEVILGKTLRAPVGSFFQVNREVIELALQHTRQIFLDSGCKTLVDAYCGIGLFALLLGDLADHIYGIEFDPNAIKAANENAARLGLQNYDFYPGKTERLLFYTLRMCQMDNTCLILDPPRSGCAAPVLKTLREYRPKKLIYISCAPPMLARDVKLLSNQGYRLERITPFDMFPQTAHCEAVAELVRK